MTRKIVGITLASLLSLSAHAAAEEFQEVRVEWRRGDRVRVIELTHDGVTRRLRVTRRAGAAEVSDSTLLSQRDAARFQELIGPIEQRGTLLAVPHGNRPLVRLRITFADQTSVEAGGPRGSEAWGWKLPAFDAVTGALLEEEARRIRGATRDDYTDGVYRRGIHAVLGQTAYGPSARATLAYLKQAIADPAWKAQKLTDPAALSRVLRRLGGDEHAAAAARLTQALGEAVRQSRKQLAGYQALGLTVPLDDGLRYSEAFQLHNALEQAAEHGFGQLIGPGPIEVRATPKDAAAAVRIPAGTRVVISGAADGWALVGFPRATKGLELSAEAKRHDRGWPTVGGFVRVSDLRVEQQPGQPVGAGAEGASGKLSAASK